ncbi:MAG TPA: glutaredoxin domain-containing protein [Kribbella sp.]|nr:glutaredoxin domain-containing protein [Kribbella sp.]
MQRSGFMAVVLRSWGSALAVLAAAALVAGISWSGGATAGAVLQFLLLAVLALLISPLAFPRSISAAEAAGAGKPIVYWRPGCQFCLRLRFSLFGSARRASWVNIWTDPEAAAAVRAVADGNETVPTVVAGGETRVNPSPHWVREHLADRQ